MGKWGTVKIRTRWGAVDSFRTFKVNLKTPRSLTHKDWIDGFRAVSTVLVDRERKNVSWPHARIRRLKILRELDIQRVLSRLRLSSLNTINVLTAEQLTFADSIIKLVLHPNHMEEDNPTDVRLEDDSTLSVSAAKKMERAIQRSSTGKMTKDARLFKILKIQKDGQLNELEREKSMLNDFDSSSSISSKQSSSRSQYEEEKTPVMYSPDP